MGVVFFEPLKPILPADDHEMAWPDLLVRVMMMLLKVALICASPTGSTTTMRFLVTFLVLAIFFVFELMNYWVIESTRTHQHFTGSYIPGASRRRSFYIWLISDG